MRFDELDLSDDILDAIETMHFGECTPIQEKTIPLVLEGKDVVAIAQTGTGKTAAYLLPVLDLLADLPAPDGTVNCVVMVPTRELAQQVEEQMDGFSYYMPLSSIAVYGGTDGATFSRQQRAMREGVDVVIATPGRLHALLQTGGGINLGSVRHFILDEADRMLDMGFYEDIMRIARQLPAERQTLLFSATMPPRTRRLASELLRDPAEVKIAPSRPVEKIAQSAVMCGVSDKDAKLMEILSQHKGEKAIVFVGSKMTVRELSRTLRRRNISAAEIHSDLEQQQRDETIRGFRAGKIDVIVATDLLARGIDIDDVALVVNYDVPREPEDYVHRIGRTGRANADGIAVTIVSPRDRRSFIKIEHTLKIKIPVNGDAGDADKMPPEAKAEKPKARRKPRYGYRKKGGRKKGSRKDAPTTPPAAE